MYENYVGKNEWNEGNDHSLRDKSLVVNEKKGLIDWKSFVQGKRIWVVYEKGT